MKIIEVIADSGHTDTITGIAAQHKATDFWPGTEDEGGRRAVRLLVSDEGRQEILDALQTALGTSENYRVLVIPVEGLLPKPEPGNDEAAKKRATGLSREELYNNVEINARLDGGYVLLVLLSTIVAAIGLLEDDVAVIIGAMVIAPLLGPNIALALATALGDGGLMWKSLKTTVVGLILSLLASLLIGFFWPLDIASRELLARTDVGLESVALALASGAAAVLSLTSGLPTVLVGVMVAVALLPPTATVGLSLGAAQWPLAAGATLLLAVNIVCVNLSAKIVFLLRGVKPRTWLDQKKARQSMSMYILFWVVSLAILLAVIYLRGHSWLMAPG